MAAPDYRAGPSKTGQASDISSYPKAGQSWKKARKKASKRAGQRKQQPPASKGLDPQPGVAWAVAMLRLKLRVASPWKQEGGGYLDDTRSVIHAMISVSSTRGKHAEVFNLRGQPNRLAEVGGGVLEASHRGCIRVESSRSTPPPGEALGWPGRRGFGATNTQSAGRSTECRKRGWRACRGL